MGGKKFAVLLTGHAPDSVKAGYGDYAQMFIDLLREPATAGGNVENEDEEEWVVFSVVDGAFPSEDDLRLFHAFVLTGSRHDAHSDEPWILRLCELIRNLHRMQKRVLGVCFGHQVVSRSLGGETGRATVGWEIGARKIDISEAFTSKPYIAIGLPKTLNVIESHRDQVSKIPPGAELLGWSSKTPVEVFAVGNHVLCIQGHPEFKEGVVLDLIQSRLELGLITEETVKDARLLVEENTPDRETWQKICRSFLKS